MKLRTLSLLLLAGIAVPLVVGKPPLPTSQSRVCRAQVSLHLLLHVKDIQRNQGMRVWVRCTHG